MPSPSTSTRASAAWSRCPSRASAKPVAVVFPALRRRTCPPPARSCCSTAAGTTAPASRRSWASPTTAQVKAFLQQAPAFEKLLVDDGILLFKYWLCCDQEQQEERFAERLEDPLKRWKLSPIDVEARKHYDDYTRAREAMLKATHTTHAPWTLVDFNDQKRGRLTLIRDLLDHACPTPTCRRRSSSSRRCPASRRRNATACSSRSTPIDGSADLIDAAQTPVRALRGSLSCASGAHRLSRFGRRAGRR